VLTLSSHDSICCLMSQFFGLWRQELLTLVHNISGNHTKGQLCWTKVSMTEHQTSRSLPKVWPWASGSLLDTPAGGNPLLRISQKQTSLCWSPWLSLCSCLPGTGLSHHSIRPTVAS
jgi:hypothetical protein